MIIDYKASVAYICPECSAVTSGSINIFNLSGGKANLHCSVKGCGAKCVSVRQKKSKYIFDAECPVCGETHSLSLSCGSFWNDSYMSLSCPMSDVDIFFKGSEKDINEALEYAAKPGGKNGTRDELLLGIIDELYLLDTIGGISCACGNKHVEIAPLEDKIALICKKCGASEIIDINMKNYEKIGNSKSIVIKKGK